MASSKEQALYQLAALLAQRGIALAPQGSGASLGAQATLGSAQSAIQAESIRAARKREEEEKKKGMFGSLGATLGSIAGIALAPATLGGSLAATAAGGAIGSAAGGALGAYAGGGSPNLAQIGGYAAKGALSGGLSYGVGQTLRGLQQTQPGVPVSSTTPEAAVNAPGATANLPTGATPPLVPSQANSPWSLAGHGLKPTTANMFWPATVGTYQANRLVGALGGGIFPSPGPQYGGGDTNPYYDPNQYSHVPVRRNPTGGFMLGGY